MSDFSWETISKLKEDDIDIKNVDYYCDLFGDANIDSWTESKHLKYLFQLAQVLINFRSEQWKMADDTLTEKNLALKSLNEQLRELENENADLQRAVSSSTGKRESILERRKFESELKRLELEVENSRIIVDKCTREKENLVNEKSELERKYDNLLKDNKQITERCEYLTSQLQEKPSFPSRISEETAYRKEISNLRAKIRIQKAEIDSLEDEKQNLWNDVQRLENNLKQASIEIDRATDDYVRMKDALKDSDKKYAEKSAECELLKTKLFGLSEQVERPDSTNDIIMNAVEEKVEEWKEILGDKEAEIVRLYKKLKASEQELREIKRDNDKSNVHALTQTLKERDIQIKSLKNQLTDSIREVEQTTKLLDDLGKQIDDTGSAYPSDRKTERLLYLQKQIEEKDVLIAELDKRVILAEEATQLQVNEINLLQKQLKRYENGEYGLGEAIAELKATKSHLNSKERQLDDICRLASQAESELNELKLENEHLRVKLGIPIDEIINVDGYRRTKIAKEEEERALNVVLQKEIEKLEDERMELKKKLRSIARHLGQQLGTGDSHIDAFLLNCWSEDNEENDLQGKMSSIIKDDLIPKPGSMEKRQECIAVPEVWRARYNVLDNELAEANKTIENERKQNDELRIRLKQITEANIYLENGLKELKEQMQTFEIQTNLDEKPTNIVEDKKSCKKQIISLECPSLEKLLATLDSKNMIDDLDTGRFLKSRIDHLEGINEELRLQLRETRMNSATFEIKFNQSQEKVTLLESQFKKIQTLDSSNINLFDSDSISKTILPEDITPDGAKTILPLEEHLLQTLKENESKNVEVRKLTQKLENAQHLFSICRHKQGLLYQDYYNERQLWLEEKRKLEECNQTQLIKINELDVYKTELTRLQEILTNLENLKEINDENLEKSNIKQKLGDLSRQITLLKVNETGLVRRFVAVQDRENALNKQNNRLKSDIIQMESAVSARLNYYSRYKEISAFQLDKLQKLLDNSIPIEEYNKIKMEYDKLASKYSQLLDRDSEIITGELVLKTTQTNLNSLRKEYDYLKEQLTIEKERRCILENSLNLFKSNNPNSNLNETILNVNDSLVNECIPKRLALIEMKELHERERANHAQNMLQTMMDTNKHLEERNKELEIMINNFTKTSTELQQNEQQLREELTDAIPKSVHQQILDKCTDLEEKNMKLRHEVDQLKEIVSITLAQNQAITDRKNEKLTEIESLHKQLADLESRDDSTAKMAHLHRQLTCVQISETSALQRLATVQMRSTKLENDILKVERRLTEKENELINLRTQNREQERHLRETINILRQRYAGCIPLKKYEEVSIRLKNILKEKMKTQIELEEAIQAKIQAESMIEGWKEKEKLFNEIHELFKDFQLNTSGKIEINKQLENKLIECQNRLIDLRVSEAAQRRQAERLKENLHHLESLVQNQETQLNDLECENARINKELEQRELQWEQQETELEEINFTDKSEPIIEENLAEIKVNSNLMTECVNNIDSTDNFNDNLPDPQLPTDVQLNQALNTIKIYSNNITNYKTENDGLKKRITELIQLIRKQDHKMHLLLNQLTIYKQNQTDNESKQLEIVNLKSNLSSLQMNMDLLQRRLLNKEESLSRLNELLKQTYETNEKTNQKHQQEIKYLQNKLHNNMENAINQLIHTVESVEQNGLLTNQTSELNKRLKNLEDALTEQNQATLRQAEKTRIIQQECDLWQIKFNQLQNQNENEKSNLEQTYKTENSALRSECDNLHKELEQSNNKIVELMNELKRWKSEATKSPSVMQKQLTERLRANLAEKDKQIKALSKVLAELRRDLVQQAEQAVLATNVNISTQAIPENKEEPIQESFIKPSQTSVSEQVVIPKLNTTKVESSNLIDKTKHLQNTNNKLNEINKKLELECKDLRNQLQDLKKSKKSETTFENVNQQNYDELVRKNSILEQENKRLRMIPEKPYQDLPKSVCKENISTTKNVSSSEWETRKRLESEINKLKEQLNNKMSDLVYLQKQLELTKSTLERSEKQNEILRERVKERWGPALLPSTTDNLNKNPNSKLNLKPLTSETLEQRVELHKQNEQLQAEIERLKRSQRIAAGLPPGTKTFNSDTMMIQTAEMRNQLLTERIQELEKQLLEKGLITQGKLQLEQAIQRDLLRINKENLEMKFELENLRTEIPRFKIRIHDLQTYVDLLKQEKEQLRSGTNLDKSFGSESSTMSNIRKIGESGKSTKELEQIIARLKKVLQRSQAENERLKCAPGPASMEEIQQYKHEIKQLQNQLEMAKLVAGEKLIDRRLINEQGMDKLKNEYELLRQNYENLLNENQQTKNELFNIKRKLNQIKEENNSS